MKLQYKGAGWNVIDTDYIRVIYSTKQLKFFDKKTNHVLKSIRTKSDYYMYFAYSKKRNFLFATSEQSNQIDVFDLCRLERVKSIEWNGGKGFTRQGTWIDEEHNCVYSILNAVLYKEISGAIITKINCSTWEEKEVFRDTKMVLFDFRFVPWKNDYLISGRKFNDPPKRWFHLGNDIGIWLKTGDSFIYPETKYIVNVRNLRSVSLLGKDIVYLVQTGGNKYNLYNLNQGEMILEGVQSVAYSSDRKYLAFMKEKKLCVMSYEARNIIDEITIKYDVEMTELSFTNSDHSLFFRNYYMGLLFDFSESI